MMFLCPMGLVSAQESMLLEIELNGERVSRGALVYPLSGGCRVEARDLKDRLILSSNPEWIDFVSAQRSCALDDRLGVARLSALPSELQTRLLPIMQPVSPMGSHPSESSLALDLIANRNGLRAGLIASHASSQLSLSFHPRGHLEHWTGSWAADGGMRLELGSITAPRAVSGLPQSFEGLRLSSHRKDSPSFGMARAHLTLQNPSRIRIINSHAQELLGLTALPAGPYRVIGPTGSTAPGFLRVLIEGAEGTVTEHILPWTQHPQLLEPQTEQWDVSINTQGSLFGSLGVGLNDRDSLWVSGSTSERSAQLQWVTSRLTASLVTGRLRLDCSRRCKPHGGASLQTSLMNGAQLNGTWNSDTGPEVSFTRPIGRGAHLAFNAARRHLQTQLSWMLSPRSRLHLSWVQTPISRVIGLQWHWTVGSSQSFTLSQRQSGRELQFAQSAQRPQALSWSIRASQRQYDLAIQRQQAWGDWHAQWVGSVDGSRASFQPQVSTRVWMTEQRIHLGPVGDYNLVNLDTGISELELMDQQGWTAQTDTRGVATFSRVPAHTTSHFKVNSQGLSLDRAIPFHRVELHADRRRAYHLIHRTAQQTLISYRLRWPEPSADLRLIDALKQSLFVSPDGYLDLQSHHRLPLVLQTLQGPVTCRIHSAQGESPLVSDRWVDCRDD